MGPRVGPAPKRAQLTSAVAALTPRAAAASIHHLVARAAGATEVKQSRADEPGLWGVSTTRMLAVSMY